MRAIKPGGGSTMGSTSGPRVGPAHQVQPSIGGTVILLAPPPPSLLNHLLDGEEGAAVSRAADQVAVPSVVRAKTVRLARDWLRALSPSRQLETVIL